MRTRRVRQPQPKSANPKGTRRYESRNQFRMPNGNRNSSNPNCDDDDVLAKRKTECRVSRTFLDHAPKRDLLGIISSPLDNMVNHNHCLTSMLKTRQGLPIEFSRKPFSFSQVRTKMARMLFIKTIAPYPVTDHLDCSSH